MIDKKRSPKSFPLYFSNQSTAVLSVFRKVSISVLLNVVKHISCCTITKSIRNNKKHAQNDNEFDKCSLSLDFQREADHRLRNKLTIPTYFLLYMRSASSISIHNNFNLYEVNFAFKLNLIEKKYDNLSRVGE